MGSLRIGQRIVIDLFGLLVSGASSRAGQAIGTVVALDPGAITVRLSLLGETAAEVTVSHRRVLSGGLSLAC